MEALVCEILVKGGVDIDLHEISNGKERNRNLSTSSLLSLLESWLGFSASEVDVGHEGFFDDGEHDCVMMEDAGPFDAEFYRSIENFLIEVWKPQDIPQHKFFGLGSNDGDFGLDGGTETTPSLYRSILSVRVTRFLRYWMDLNVGGGGTGRAMAVDADEEGNGDYERRSTSLSFHLMKNCSFDIKATSALDSSKKLRFYPLIHALYQQIEQLPYLQSQIYAYSQSLSRVEGGNNGLNRPGVGVADPKSRLEQLQRGQRVKERLDQEFANHVLDLEFIVGEWYSLGSVDVRRQARAQLGSVWSGFELRATSGGGSSSLSGSGMRSENTSSSGVAMTLRVLHRILLGTAVTKKTGQQQEEKQLRKSYEHLLFQHLIPLHRPNSMVLWRDQTCLLELYHEPLVKCIAILLRKKPELTGKVIEGLLAPDIWNKGAGNTPKLVLLLHEIDTYIGCLPGTKTHDGVTGSELGDSLPALLRTLGSSMASENSRLAQRALPFVKNKTFVRLIEKNMKLTLEILLPFLFRKEPSWNPTVRKMTYTVLTTLQELDPELFVSIGNRFFAKNDEHREQKRPLPGPPADSSSGPKANNNHAVRSAPRDVESSLLPADYTIRSAMAGWTPPARSGNAIGTNDMVMATFPRNRRRGISGSNSNPPVSVTGVAPWAMKGPSGTSSNPPLGITGVAPWAMKGPREDAAKTTTMSGRKHPPMGKSVAPWAAKKNKLPMVPRALRSETTGKTAASNNDAFGNGSLPKGDGANTEPAPCRVKAYMDMIKPPEEEQGISSWSKTQMEESPTLLPTLRFYDLVFGHTLGEGSFGCVRYARRIDRTTTRSHWSEYAVKVVSTEKIKEIGYEAPLQRELAVLRVLSHPCIARMISSFRFREGVYFVLEYASGGDLHTLLKTNGSLDHESTRFVIGEVTSALASIHEIGLGYFDLKPENIVITESRHVKLTDFGGCRPVTQAAKKMIRDSARNAFLQLRDGGWKKTETKAKSFDMDDENDDDETKTDGFLQDYDPDTDLRIEGTTIYLPPEVALGSFPTLAADSWALGCVMYQCLTGRPPIPEADDRIAKQRIVAFDLGGARGESGSNGESILFAEPHASSTEEPARDLIRQLLRRFPHERPRMTRVADHFFFEESGVDVFALWRQPSPLPKAGDPRASSPPPLDAGWARRQLSKIWAPQPRAYDLSSSLSVSSEDPFRPVVRLPMRMGCDAPIREGDEGPFFFSRTSVLRGVRPKPGGIPMPTREKGSGK